MFQVGPLASCTDLAAAHQEEEHSGDGRGDFRKGLADFEVGMQGPEAQGTEDEATKSVRDARASTHGRGELASGAASLRPKGL